MLLRYRNSYACMAMSCNKIVGFVRAGSQTQFPYSPVRQKAPCSDCCTTWTKKIHETRTPSRSLSSALLERKHACPPAGHAVVGRATPTVARILLTDCAACAAPLGLASGKKCSRCSTRYCGPACQKTHWEEGGHDKLCKQIRRGGGAEQYHADQEYKEAVAEAVEKCAEDTKGQTCYICT